MGIDEQLIKEERIKTKLVEIFFKLFNTNRTKNKEVTRIAPLEVKVNEHKEQIDVAVTDLNSMNMFLGYDWLVRHNSKVNWKEGIIQFTRCLRSYRTSH